MKNARTLVLKREALQELSDGELDGLAGGTLRPTAYSCLDYISCYAVQCLPDALTGGTRCIE